MAGQNDVTELRMILSRCITAI